MLGKGGGVSIESIISYGQWYYGNFSVLVYFFHVPDKILPCVTSIDVTVNLIPGVF